MVVFFSPLTGAATRGGDRIRRDEKVGVRVASPPRCVMPAARLASVARVSAALPLSPAVCY